MQFRDLKKQYENLKCDIDSAIFQTIESGTFIGGTSVVELEKQLAD